MRKFESNFQKWCSLATKRLTLTAFSIIAVLSTFVSSTHAQVQMNARNNKASYDISEYETINKSDGKFSFSLPVVSTGARGPANGINLRIEKNWRQDQVVIGYSGSMPNTLTRIAPDPFDLNGLFPQLGGYLIVNLTTHQTNEVGACSNESVYRAALKEYSINFVGFGGQSFELISQTYPSKLITFNNGQCWSSENFSIGNTFYAADGSGAMFIANQPVVINDELQGNGDGLPFITVSGNLKLPDGTTYAIVNGLVSSITDRNGNRTTLVNTGFQVDPRENRVTSIKDSLNREITVTNDANFSYVNYKGFGGANRTIKVSNLSAGTSTAWVHDLFPWVGVNDPNNYGMPCNAQNYVELPNQTRYTFTYNCYGELARVQLPTGGKVEYSYENAGGNYSLKRRIKERRLYSDGVNLDNRLTFTYSEFIPETTGTPIPSEIWTIERVYDAQNTLLSMTKTYFTNCIPDYSNPCVVQTPGGYTDPRSQAAMTGQATITEIYAADGTTVLQRTENEYEPLAQIYSGNVLMSIGPRLKKVTNTLVDSNQVSVTEYGYDPSVSYNLKTDVFEYDYGIGQPGPLIRRSHTDYLKTGAYATNDVNLRNLPVSTWVSTDINGTNIVSRLEYEYDNYTAGANTAPLVDRVNITGHELAYGTGFTPRGNLTRMTGYSNAQAASGAISSYRQYDIAGNVVKTIDAKGNQSLFDFGDRFGGPDAEARSNAAPIGLAGQQTFAFVTKRTNTVGFSTYTQYDYSTGLIVDGEDLNGNVNSFYVNDPLERSTKSIVANNRPLLRAQTLTTYDDANRRVIVTTDSKQFGDGKLKSETYFDGFGRTIETRQYDGPATFAAKLTQYDALGRVWRISNPYKPSLNEPIMWAERKYDNMGRVIEAKTADNARTRLEYTGSTTKRFDQANKVRSSVFDALGRQTKAIEYSGTQALETFYQYDALGRLRKTQQGVQSRFFLYDDFGRLIRTKQPEQTANPALSVLDPLTSNNQWSAAYVYDNNGNIVSTTDARGVTITNTFDNLDRLRFRDYSDATPDVSYIYDDAAVPNSKGRLTSVSSTSSTTKWTSFDELGRVMSSSQQVDGNVYNFPNYTYDLAGNLVSETYPSGRVVTNETNDIGRITRVFGSVPGRGDKTYLNSVTYSSAGGMTGGRLGNGKWESYVYDPARLQVTQIGLGNSANDASLLKIEYGYSTVTGANNDNNGNVRQQRLTVPGISGTLVQNYSYDDLNRLTLATETTSSNGTTSWQQGFTYDRYGNRSLNAGQTTNMPANAAVNNPDADPATNRFLASQGYGYDAEGNLTSDPEGRIIAYNAENKQTQITNTSNGSVSQYFYDGQGKRVKVASGNQQTTYVYDAFGKLVAEYTSNIALTSIGTQYLTRDNLGTPRVITDGIGAIISRHDYKPFGEELSFGTGNRTTAMGYLTNASGIRQDAVSQQFTGLERDVESGLDFAQGRYLSSKHGRFTSVDPLASSLSVQDPQSLNRFAYVGNNPYRFTDPSGLSKCGVSGGPGAAPGRICTQEESPDTIIGIIEVTPPPDPPIQSDASEGTPDVPYGEWYLPNWLTVRTYSDGQTSRMPRRGPDGYCSMISPSCHYEPLWYPKEFNDLMHDFAKKEEQAGYDDEVASAKWFLKEKAGVSFPGGVDFGKPNPSNYGDNYEAYKGKLVDSIKNSTAYTEKEKEALIKGVNGAMRKASDENRVNGENRAAANHGLVQQARGYLTYYVQKFRLRL